MIDKLQLKKQEKHLMLYESCNFVICSKVNSKTLTKCDEGVFLFDIFTQKCFNKKSFRFFKMLLCIRKHCFSESVPWTHKIQISDLILSIIGISSVTFFQIVWVCFFFSSDHESNINNLVYAIIFRNFTRQSPTNTILNLLAFNKTASYTCIIDILRRTCVCPMIRHLIVKKTQNQ